MAKKKKLTIRPWCWYCERDFDSEKLLIEHQRKRHYTCKLCDKKNKTLSSLSEHSRTEHDRVIEKVPFALPGRDSIEIVIRGTEGIPEKDVQIHAKKIEAQFEEEQYSESADKGTIDQVVSNYTTGNALVPHAPPLSYYPPPNPAASGLHVGYPIAHFPPENYYHASPGQMHYGMQPEHYGPPLLHNTMLPVYPGPTGHADAPHPLHRLPSRPPHSNSFGDMRTSKPQDSRTSSTSYPSRESITREPLPPKPDTNIRHSPREKTTSIVSPDKLCHDDTGFPRKSESNPPFKHPVNKLLSPCSTKPKRPRENSPGLDPSADPPFKSSRTNDKLDAVSPPHCPVMPKPTSFLSPSYPSKRRPHSKEGECYSDPKSRYSVRNSTRFSSTGLATPETQSRTCPLDEVIVSQNSGLSFEQLRLRSGRYRYSREDILKEVEELHASVDKHIAFIRAKANKNR